MWCGKRAESKSGGVAGTQRDFKFWISIKREVIQTKNKFYKSKPKEEFELGKFKEIRQKEKKNEFC